MKAFPKDIKVQTMKVRHIGVESELSVRGDFVMLERELDKRGLLQSVGYDGGGREFRTVPISVHSLLKQVRGHKYLTEYYEALSKQTRVTDRGGTHIHISILESDNPNMEANATAMASAFYDQLQKISGRQSHWAWKFSQEHYISTIEGIRTAINRRREEGRSYRFKGSMLNPTYHGTLEFRGPKGSNNSKEILAWVELLNNIVKTCNKTSIEGVPFRSLLKGEHISKYVRYYLRGWRKLTEDELNMKFNGANLQ